MEMIDMMILAGTHMHHAAGAWPIMAVVGVLLLAGLCAAIVLLTRRTSGLPSPTGQAGGTYGVGHDVAPSDFGGPVAAPSPETSDHAEDDYDFDARILAMLQQKGEPMPQAEIAANLGMNVDSLASWLAGMERREMLRRTWDPARATYVVHVPAES